MMKHDTQAVYTQGDYQMILQAQMDLVLARGFEQEGDLDSAELARQRAAELLNFCGRPLKEER